MVEKERVCVTGAGGFLASWLVNLLLSQGYVVHGTVRDPNDDEKNFHLKKLENAEKYLHLFKAHLLDYGSILAAIEGCSGVFHVASPVPAGNVPNPQVELIQPAVTGTSNVLKACSMANIKKVVVVSSVSAIMLNPNWPKNQAMDESCWSDHDYCRKTENWYGLAKTEAEALALEYGKTRALNVVTVCPSFIIGPLLQSKMNATSGYLLKMVRDGLEKLENKVRPFVDVRDTAEALLLVYKKPEAEGRYICSSFTLRLGSLVNKLKNMYPNYNYPKQIVEGEADWDITSAKLVKLGWKHRSPEETLVDSIKNYEERGLLGKVDVVAS